MHTIVWYDEYEEPSLTFQKALGPQRSQEPTPNPSSWDQLIYSWNPDTKSQVLSVCIPLQVSPACHTQMSLVDAVLAPSTPTRTEGPQLMAQLSALPRNCLQLKGVMVPFIQGSMLPPRVICIQWLGDVDWKEFESLVPTQDCSCGASPPPMSLAFVETSSQSNFLPFLPTGVSPESTFQ